MSETNTMPEVAVPEVAFRKGFHRLTAYDMNCQCRAALKTCPACEFEGLQAGKAYYYKPSYGEERLVAVTQTTPKGRQAVASVNQREPHRIYKGDFHDEFIELDADLRALIGVTHEMIVAAAVAAGLDVPAEVRREYPALFVEIPERFANGRFSAVERVTQSLTPPPLAKAPVSVADIDAWIDESHHLYNTIRCEATRRIALNHRTAPEYERILAGHRDDIEFYCWLRNLVDVGGVFHIPAPAAGNAA